MEDSKMEVMTCLFYSGSIDGDSSGQEQGGQGAGSSNGNSHGQGKMSP